MFNKVYVCLDILTLLQAPDADPINARFQTSFNQSRNDFELRPQIATYR